MFTKIITPEIFSGIKMVLNQHFFIQQTHFLILKFMI